MVIGEGDTSFCIFIRLGCQVKKRKTKVNKTEEAN